MLFSLNYQWRPAYHAALAVLPSSSDRRLWLIRTLILACASFLLPFAVRALEIQMWGDPSFRYEGEYLLATQDAYHWIAGAEGFEFGTGHPMSEFLRMLSFLAGTAPANVGFWLPLFLGSLLSVGVFLWGLALGHARAGFVAGCLASLAPGFLRRTMLGYCDTDLVILLFATLLGFVPMCWLLPWLCGFRKEQPLRQSIRYLWQCAVNMVRQKRPLGRFVKSDYIALWRPSLIAESPAPIILQHFLTYGWLITLVVAGTWGHWTQEWHSYFRYGVRFTALGIPILIAVLGPYGGRKYLLAGALCFCIPLLGDLPGAFLGLLWALVLGTVVFVKYTHRFPFSLCAQYIRLMDSVERWAFSRWTLLALWGFVFIMLGDTDVWSALIRSIFSYVKGSGDIADGAAGSIDPLIYPSVAQSISEVRNIGVMELFRNFHPFWPLSAFAMLGYIALVFVFPGLIFLLPLLLISLSSLALGERMAMFGAPVLALGLCLSMAYGIQAALRVGSKKFRLISSVYTLFEYDKIFSLARFFVALCVVLSLVFPMTRLIMDSSKGPIISKEQVEALVFLRKMTPPDSVVWNWWDWGYATHHFSRRKTVCDGARHGGPSLYVPAAVYTTADPHFARQLMAYTSEKGGDPGDIFEKLTGTGAMEMLTDLASGKLAPVMRTKQYIVMSYDVVPLGYWISTYGTWDFKRKVGQGYYISPVTSHFQYNADTGTMLIRGVSKKINASSIDVFENKTMKHYVYKNGDPNQHFVLNYVTGESFTIDDNFYDSLMYKLLISPPDDPQIKPYFTLVFDNGQARVFEVH